MKTILRFRDGREVMLRRRGGNSCPIVDLEKEARKGLFSLVVQDGEGNPGLVAFIWANAKPRVARDPYLAGGEVLAESARGSARGSNSNSKRGEAPKKGKNNEHQLR